VTELLENEDIDLIYSSPYKRAVQTVEGIARCIDKEIVLVDDFRERLLAGEPVDNFTEAISKVWENDNFSWSGGESNKAAQKRGVHATLSILENNAHKNVVVGTHGNIMVLIMNYFDKQYGYEFWKGLEMPDIYKLSFNGRNLVIVRQVWNQ